MNTIRKTEVPPDSLVEKYLPADYTDAFSCEVVTEKPFTADDVVVGFWTGQTGWVAALFRLRHFFVRFVGLQGDDGLDLAAFERCIREGGSYRFASVPAKNDHETVLLLSDKHLDAWLSVYVAEGEREQGDDVCGQAGTTGEVPCKTIFAITVVRFHNRLGRVYFFLIRPFHNLVVQSMLRQSIERVK